VFCYTKMDRGPSFLPSRTTTARQVTERGPIGATFAWRCIVAQPSNVYKRRARMARVGRPTDDPKGKLIAVRVASRHIRLLERRAAQERVTLSEALRRYLDESGGALGARQDGRESPRKTKPRT
jgi:hypothetical protein